MNYFILLTIPLTLSLSYNHWLYRELKKVNAELIKSKASPPPPPKVQSIELQEFLSDLMVGPAMLMVARVDQSNLLMRSPKNR